MNDPLHRFVEAWSRVPGIGTRLAERMGLFFLGQSVEYCRRLADALIHLREQTHICQVCGNFSDGEVCAICEDETRDRSVICVVETPLDITYIEATKKFHGLYHVLGGVISPLHGITPSKLRIEELVARVEQGKVEEIFFATSPTTEGDATAQYVRERLAGYGLRFTVLARGVPIGVFLPQTGTQSLSEAIVSREEMK
ncbi:recombination mediator RecR [Thermospira aquatica]|uniref:Recombination protein RecR n=1 Tax=Thermospira aquatica TaxID=2828656 RepID=A0AAX3BAZ9_9SPIR|nr:recombination mediator RecR [Thermospira aquatica]URA09487.1 recombination mediator RecR [Thermospira aquatica]